MKVTSVLPLMRDATTIRGHIAETVADRDGIKPPLRLRRASDGAEWDVANIKRNCLSRDLWAGERVGFFLPADADVKEGDEIEIVGPSV